MERFTKNSAKGENRCLRSRPAGASFSAALRNNLPEILIDLADQNERTSDNARHINYPQQGPRQTFV